MNAERQTRATGDSLVSNRSLWEAFPSDLVGAAWGLLVAITAPAAAPDWVYEAVHPEKTAGGYGAVLDAQDYAHVVYGLDALYYDWQDADGWQSETADAAVAPAPDNIFMALDDAGRPHVVYVDLLTYHLKYARRDSVGWSIETIAEDVFTSYNDRFAAFCLDAAGQPHVGYRTGDYQTTQLKYLSRGDSGWHTTTVASYSNDRMIRLIITVADNGQPHLAWGRLGSDMYHAWPTSSAWQTAHIDIPGLLSSLEFDAAGRLHMLYRPEPSWRGAAYVVGTFRSFVTEQFYTTSARPPALMLDRAGNPHVVFASAYDSPYNLQYWTRVRGRDVWRQTIVDGTDAHNRVASDLVCTLDDEARPHILYRMEYTEGTGHVPKYAWLDTDGWHNRDEPSAPFPSGTLMVTRDDQLRLADNSAFYSREADGWHERMLAQPGDSVRDIRLVLDTQNNPHLVYSGNAGCSYRRRNAGGWQTTLLEDSSPRMLFDFVLDHEEHPHVGYYSRDSRLGYAILTEHGWETSVVDSNYRPDEISLALDLAGRPHLLSKAIEWPNGTGARLLLHFWQDDSGWHRETVAQLNSTWSNEQYPNIAVDQEGGLHICYYDAYVSRALRYGYRGAQGWQFTTVDGNGSAVGQYCSLTLDDQDQPHIVYGVEEPGQLLRYAHKNATGWHISTVDSWGDPGSFIINASFCLSPDGTPHITFNTGEDVFRYAWLGAGGWEWVDIERGSARSSLALDSEGRAHIAYAGVRGNLAYLWPPDAFHRIDWSAIPSPQDVAAPVPVTLTARNSDGEIRTAFTGSATLSGYEPGLAPTDLVVGAGTNDWEYPFYARYHDARTQVIYYADERDRACTFTSLALEVTTPPGQTLENWTIRLKHTTMGGYSASPEWHTNGWTVVYQGDEPAGAAGWRTFEFSTPFEFNGVNNLLVDFSFNNSSYSSEGQCRSTVVGGYPSITAFSDSRDGDPLDWSGVSPLPVRSHSGLNLVLGATVPGSIPVSVSPATVGPFVDGVWTGVVSVMENAADLVLVVDDGAGHGGESNPFDVQGIAQPLVIVSDDGYFGLSDGCFGFGLLGQDGQVVVIEGSTDLQGWLPLQTNTVGGGPVHFSDPSTPIHPYRYYRLLQP